MTIQNAPLQAHFWNQVANQKEYCDPFYIDKFKLYVPQDAKVIEYGCGYGRVLNQLQKFNYRHLFGFDFAEKMIERGRKSFPKINFQHIHHANLPLKDQSIDAALLSTVLCCVPSQDAQKEIIQEIRRVLKPGGILYLTDFLITENENMLQKYQQSLALFNEWGVYRTSEGAIVRHHSSDYINKLLAGFSEDWYLEENSLTMNNNPVRSFHGIYINSK